MRSIESKDEVLVMVLVDLAGICKKLAANSAVPDALRMRARQFATGIRHTLALSR